MTDRTLSKIGEFGLIARLAKGIHLQKDIIKGIGDDTAVLPFTREKYLLFTTDILCSGVHFLAKERARLIGRKALACSLSDIAAMGGKASAAVVSIGLPKECRLRYVEDIYRGMNGLAKEFRVSIVGGDTIQSPRLIVNVALLGEVKRKHLVLRSGAKAGDKIFVTGPLGRSFPTKIHLSFTPRLVEAQKLVQSFKPSAMIDISDGLAADLGHILQESAKSAILDTVAIPRRKNATLRNALFDGEDFELLFTVSSRTAKKLFAQKALKVFCIGEIVCGPRKLFLRDSRGHLKALKPKGYTHF